MCDVSVEAGRPSVRAVAVSRVVERSLRDSDAVDVESLCIIAGEKVWSIRCVAHVLDDGGNVTDCVSLAVAAALLHCRRPDLTVDGHRVVLHSTHERAPVPLGIHHLPICVSFDFFDVDNDDEFTEADLYADDTAPKRAHLADNFVLDATTLERDACRGTVTMAFNAHGELCLINKSGGVPLTPARILQYRLDCQAARLGCHHCCSRCARSRRRQVAARIQRQRRRRRRRVLQTTVVSTATTDGALNKQPRRIASMSTAVVERR
jgi:exosome complex component RRP45